MKLWLTNDEVLEVKYWSFFKCHLLAHLMIMLIFFGIGFFVGLMFEV